MGRKRKGRDGSRVSREYLRATLYLHPADKAKLRALSAHLGVSFSEVVALALDCYVETLEPAARGWVEREAVRFRAAAP